MISSDRNRSGAGDELGPGVRAIEHTADVGLEVDAPDLAELLRRAAAGMEALVSGPGPQDAGTEPQPEVRLELDAPDVALLLADWLRELLYLRQVRGRAFLDADFARLGERELDARVHTAPAGPPLREIKGVTYHGLEATRAGGGWHARVIFDV